MSNLDIQWPEVCAWCGLRHPTSKREVNLRSSSTDSSSRRWTRIEFSAPICAECADYARRLDDNTRKIRKAIVGPSLILGTVLSILMLIGDELVMVIVLGPVLGVLIMSVAFLLLAVTGLDKRWRHWGLDDPPLEYASEDADPCALYTSGTIRFHNAAYHERFAALNPELAWQPKG